MDELRRDMWQRQVRAALTLGDDSDGAGISIAHPAGGQGEDVRPPSLRSSC